MSSIISNNSPLPSVSYQKGEMPKNDMGNTVSKRIATLVVGLKLANDVATFAATKGPQAICVAATFGDAVAHLYNGNVMKGTVMGAASLKSAYDLFMQNGSLEEIKKLLQDNKAGLEVTSEILGFNKIVLKQAADGVTSIGKNLSSVEKDLSKIKQLSDENRSELKAEKLEVMKLYNAANTQYAEAQKCFKEAHHLAEEANVYFEKTMKGFKQIADLAQKSDAKISDAIEIAEKMQKNCELAQQKLQQCMRVQEQAKLHSDQANEMNQTASFKSGELFGKAEKVLSEIQDVTVKAQEKIEKAQQKNDKLAQNVQRLQQNNDNLVRLNETLLSNNDRLMKEAENAPQFGMTSIIFGAVPGALLGNAVAGPVVGGLGGGLAGLEVVHNRAKIARKTGDWLFGIKQESQVSFAGNDKVAFKFDDNSSGMWGRYIAKTQSKTVGTVGIKLGNNEVFDMRFNLKDSNVVSNADLKNLKDILERKLVTNQLSTQECLAIINALEKMRISGKTAIDPSHPIFYMLKMQLQAVQ